MKKIWDKKSMLNFSRQAYNEKVTDCHALFRILRFFELGCFLGRNIDLGGSFPTHDLKFGQFCNSTKNFGRPKFCWNFSEIFRFFFEQFWKKYYFPGSFFTENFAKWLWLLAIFHTPLVYKDVWNIGKLKKMSFKGLEKRSRNIFYNLLLWNLACLPLYIGRIPVNCQWVSDI